MARQTTNWKVIPDSKKGNDRMSVDTIEMPEATRRELEARIIGRAWKDEAFKRELVTNPKGTLEKFHGRPMPEGLKVAIHEEDASEMHMVLPLASAGEPSGGQDAAAKTRRDVELMLAARARQDAAFKRELTADPKGTLERYSGQALPADLRLVVHEEDASHLHLVLPVAPTNPGELSDEELDKVAGGTDLLTTLILAGLIIGGGAVVAVEGAVAAAGVGAVAAGLAITIDANKRAGW